MSDALHVTGVVSAQEARVDDGGLVAVEGPTALDVRTGVMVGPGAHALVTGTSATAPMTVNIAAHHWTTTRGSANGPYRGAAESTKTVNIAAAPGSGTRVDVVYVKMQDNTAGVPTPDGAVGELYGVLQGTVGAGKPSLSTIVGAEELATVSVSAGATSTNGAGVTITNTARLTAARGGLEVFRAQSERTGATTWPGRQGVELDTKRRVWHDGTRWRYEGDRVQVANTTERDAIPSPYAGLLAALAGGGGWVYNGSSWEGFADGRILSNSYNANGPSSVGATETMFDANTFTAVANRRYKLTWDGVWVCNTSISTVTFTVRTAAGASVTSAGALQYSRTIRAMAFGEFLDKSITTEISSLAAGTTTVGIGVKVALGSGTVSIPGSADNLRKLILEDIGS